MFWAHFVASEATTASKTASEVRSDLRFEISDLNYLHNHVYIVYIAPLGGSEASAASNQPQRSNLTSDLKSQVTPITYLSCAYCLYGMGPFGIL